MRWKVGSEIEWSTSTSNYSDSGIFRYSLRGLESSKWANQLHQWHHVICVNCGKMYNCMSVLQRPEKLGINKNVDFTKHCDTALSQSLRAACAADPFIFCQNLPNICDISRQLQNLPLYSVNSRICWSAWILNYSWPHIKDSPIITCSCLCNWVCTKACMCDCWMEAMSVWYNGSFTASMSITKSKVINVRRLAMW